MYFTSKLFFFWRRLRYQDLFDSVVVVVTYI